MNELPEADNVYSFPSSNQYFVVQNMSKKIEADSTVPVLLLDENQTEFVNNFFCSNNFQEDVDAFFASDDLGNELLRFDKEKSFNSLINVDDDMGDIIHGQKEDPSNSDIDIEGVSEDERIPTPKSEKTIYLCSQCSTPFGSIEECKEHMIKDHRLDLLLESVPASGSLRSDSAGSPASPLTAPDQETESNTEEATPSVNSISLTENNASDPIQRDEEANEVQDPETEIQNPEDEVQKTTTSLPEPISETQEIDPDLEFEPEPEPEGPGPEAEFLKDPEFIAKSYRCDFLGCCIRFTSHKGCVMHQDCHEVNSRMYACSQENCNEKFATWKQCNLHLWKAHQIDIDLFSCPMCSVYKTWSKHSLRTHAKIHFDEKRYTCRKCNKKFKQKSQLVNHLAGVHAKKNYKQSANVDDSNKWYTEKVCKICSKTYADSKCLKKHVQAVHRKMKPYVCNICGHKSAKKAMMQTHIRSHTGEKPYACTFEGCSYRTVDHNSLRRHLMVHTGNRPYRCSFCSFASIQSSALKKHLSAKHSQEKGGVCFCTLCPFSTINPILYENHMNDHSKGLIEGNSQTVAVEAPPCITLPTDDEDTTNCFPADDGIVTGGITIPAEPNEEPIILLPPNCNSEFETNALIEG